MVEKSESVIESRLSDLLACECKYKHLFVFYGVDNLVDLIQEMENYICRFCDIIQELRPGETLVSLEAKNARC